MSLEQLVEQRREEIRRIASRHGVTRIQLFGSVARGQSHAGSDLDLLIEVGPQTSPWFPGGLVFDLESLLGCRVDVVTETALSPGLRDVILKDARPL
jgi:predicted nucleotidyltransferase